MMCHGDMTFCSAGGMCINMDCRRNAQHAYNQLNRIPEEQRLPIAMADFKDTEACIGYESLMSRLGMKEK